MTNKNVARAKKLLPPAKVHKLTLIFTALSDANRLKMVSVISKFTDICVTDMSRILKISTPAVSQHFKILELAGMVKRVRRGRMICYKVNDQNALVKCVLKLITD